MKFEKKEFIKHIQQEKYFLSKVGEIVKLKVSHFLNFYFVISFSRFLAMESCSLYLVWYVNQLLHNFSSISSRLEVKVIGNLNM